MIRVHNIQCKHLDNDELFFGADHRVYPCCFLYDEEVSSDVGIQHIYDKYGKDFNNLEVHTLKEIMDSPWYTGELEKSLNKEDELHCTRCWLSCGDKGSRKTQKNVEG